MVIVEKIRNETDLSLIEQNFPGRSRNDIKNKFKKEEKLRPKFLDDAGKFFFLFLHYNVFIIKLKFSNNRRFERRRKRKPRSVI